MKIKILNTQAKLSWFMTYVSSNSNVIKSFNDHFINQLPESPLG